MRKKNEEQLLMKLSRKSALQWVTSAMNQFRVNFYSDYDSLYKGIQKIHYNGLCILFALFKNVSTVAYADLRAKYFLTKSGTK